MILSKTELLEYKADENNDIIYSNMNNFMDYIYQKDLYQYTNDIYDENGIKDKLKYELDKSGWERVKYMLDGIITIKEYYYIEDGYGNFRNITNRDINNLIDEMITDLSKSKEDYELQ